MREKGTAGQIRQTALLTQRTLASKERGKTASIKTNPPSYLRKKKGDDCLEDTGGVKKPPPIRKNEQGRRAGPP